MAIAPQTVASARPGRAPASSSPRWRTRPSTTARRPRRTQMRLSSVSAAMDPSQSGCGLSLARHLAARIGAPAARLGAALAMVHLVLGAFLAAGLAHVCAQCADLLGKLARACHRPCGVTTQRGAVKVETYAAGKSSNILFCEARRRAVIARIGAAFARLDAVGILFMGHRDSPREGGWAFLEPARLAKFPPVVCGSRSRHGRTWDLGSRTSDGCSGMAHLKDHGAT